MTASQIVSGLQDLYSDTTRVREDKQKDYQDIAAWVVKLQGMLKTAPINEAERNREAAAAEAAALTTKK